MRYVLAILGAAFLAGVAYTAGASKSETKTTTVVVGLPAPVARTRAALVQAVKARDADALRKLMPAGAFSFTFGSERDPIAYWNELEKKGQHPYTTLARILALPYSLRQGHYVWPFAYGTPKGELTPYERRLLGPLASSYVGEDYYGWRAGIKPDGSWSFYVAGD
jgi:hypothetical protein